MRCCTRPRHSCASTACGIGSTAPSIRHSASISSRPVSSIRSSTVGYWTPLMRACAATTISTQRSRRNRWLPWSSRRGNSWRRLGGSWRGRNDPRVPEAIHYSSVGSPLSTLFASVLLGARRSAPGARRSMLGSPSIPIPVAIVIGSSFSSRRPMTGDLGPRPLDVGPRTLDFGLLSRLSVLGAPFPRFTDSPPLLGSRLSSLGSPGPFSLSPRTFVPSYFRTLLSHSRLARRPGK